MRATLRSIMYRVARWLRRWNHPLLSRESPGADIATLGFAAKASRMDGCTLRGAGVTDVILRFPTPVSYSDVTSASERRRSVRLTNCLNLKRRGSLWFFLAFDDQDCMLSKSWFGIVSGASIGVTRLRVRAGAGRLGRQWQHRATRNSLRRSPCAKNKCATVSYATSFKNSRRAPLASARFDTVYMCAFCSRCATSL